MKVIVKNLFSLGFVHGINLLIPLLVTPYLIETLGVISFGVISTAQSLIFFFVIFTDFGFNITSVRRLAQAQNNPTEIEAIINGVFFLKLFLLLISFVLFVILVLLVPQFNKHIIIYLCSFTMVIGQAFLPIWFFQGMEIINKTVIPVVVFKLLTLALIFLVVTTEAESPYVNLLFGFGNICTGIILYFFISKEYKISIRSVNINILKNEFRESLAIFVSNIGVVIYGNTSLIILSFFLTPTTLGIYSIVDKIIQISKALLAIIHQVSYPRLCNIIKKDEASLIPFIKKLYGIVWVVVLVLCTTMFFEPDFYVSYFVKNEQSRLLASYVLKSFSFILFIISLNMPFFQSLLAYKKDWLTVKILFGCSILSIILNLILVPIFKIEGAIITTYFIETMVTTLLIYYMVHLKKNYEKRNLPG